jgi:hypothetical protein
MRSLTPTGLKVERLAKQQDGQTVGATIAAILDVKGPRAPIPDEQLLQTRVGRLLAERRRRWAEGGFSER